MQRVAIVDPTESTRESLRTLLLGVDFVWLDNECARYEYFADVIRDNPPELAIVALDADKGKALTLIQQLAVEHPALPILTISHDHQALLQSLQKGAKYFLTHPVGLQDILSALRRALGEHSGGGTASGRITQNTTSSVIAVLGSRGGVGTTTIGVNLAATLAADPNHAVALIDLDLALGDADISLEVSGSENISIADLAHNIERLDMNFLRRALAKHEPTGLSILRHPLEIGQVGLIHEQHVERIVNLLKMSYTHLILDLSKGLNPTDLTGLRLADQILLVAQLELASLRNVVRLLHCLGGEEGLVEKIRVVINRQGADTIEEGISIKKAEEVIGKPIFWQIPNESKAVIGARVAGHPLIKYAPRSAVQKSLSGLVDAMYGKTTASSNKGSKGGWGLFGKRG
ncbi:response regulator receiver protein : Response regulator receiver protein OS=Pirellula staleyi (strain ATCC 27377 / DSM 6068 / ICPB 4128) GN=Psta_2077 PE=4 SV=1: Response_reg: AAA_31 [Gemmataceae bacterium]|nr:response regulator receiver protein : Response regulator receiver protein OS=Pirellula staleyi (strain ATCC 27377 / DSM 6068 / ICPB 4128) GN=Psta_2077 PE=4 SV=1: Response_reg: AAA_31 [Gemmataceae bacterium]VTT99935.1 response regulator receiver protein : Response regulator receiver protein OS=Pirellula staleyi (strain ATCC 27377 / DSM 6068 / ICPB 4128) GN=Psta_2077 PE=4 SV=1: Response_reg: AAA_31 [Gemmataceae bacterium]